MSASGGGSGERLCPAHVGTSSFPLAWFVRLPGHQGLTGSSEVTALAPKLQEPGLPQRKAA